MTTKARGTGEGREDGRGQATASTRRLNRFRAEAAEAGRRRQRGGGWKFNERYSNYGLLQVTVGCLACLYIEKQGTR